MEGPRWPAASTDAGSSGRAVLPASAAEASREGCLRTRPRRLGRNPGVTDIDECYWEEEVPADAESMDLTSEVFAGDCVANLMEKNVHDETAQTEHRQVAADPEFAQRASTDLQGASEAEGIPVSVEEIKAYVGLPQASDQDAVEELQKRIAKTWAHS
jgi:hypothetical protein